MKHILLAIIILLSFSLGAQAKKETFVGYNYELSLVKENAASASGFKIFKVWSYAKKKEVLTQEICMRNAIHGILFKGLAASDVGTQGNFPALCPEGYDAHQEYFDGFFGSGRGHPHRCQDPLRRRGKCPEECGIPPLPLQKERSGV